MAARVSGVSGHTKSQRGPPTFLGGPCLLATRSMLDLGSTRSRCFRSGSRGTQRPPRLRPRRRLHHVSNASYAKTWTVRRTHESRRSGGRKRARGKACTSRRTRGGANASRPNTNRTTSGSIYSTGRSSKSVSMKIVSSFQDVSIFSRQVSVMNILVWMILLVLVLWIFFPRPGAGRFRSFEDQVHVYSGLDPSEWKLFLTEIRAFDQGLDVAHLYRAVEHVRNIGLMNTNFTDDLNALADRLGYDGERIARPERPKFLNEVIPDQPFTYYLNDSKPMDTIYVNPTGIAVGNGFVGRTRS